MPRTYGYTFNHTSTHAHDDSCPFNEFCTKEARHNCSEILLSSCVHCNVFPLYTLTVFLTFLGIAIVLGNGLILLVCMKRYREGTIIKNDPIKMSLAVADLLSGIQIYIVVVPTLTWELNSTAFEISQLRMSNSPKCGVLFILSFSSSLYHLILLGCQRWHAMQNPQQFLRKSMKGIYKVLAAVWILAALTAATPGFLPQYYRYCSRNHLCFVCSTSVLAHIILYSIYLFIPFTFMTVVSVTVALIAYRKLKASFKLKTTTPDSWKERGKAIIFSKQQLVVFKTVAIMQIGFTITLGPSVAVLILVFMEALDCWYADAVETVCFVLYFTNSLVNVVIYGLREVKFRNDAISVLKTIKSICKNRLTFLNNL